MSFDAQRPFNELPALPPAKEIETRATLKACIRARTALSDLKRAGQLIPNQDILINSIPVLEAQASSEIENIVTTADRLFRFATAEGGADPRTKEALRYRVALQEGFYRLPARPLGTNTCVEVCTTILGVQTDVRTTPGTTLMNDLTGEVIYTPPEGESVIREKLANWEKFLHEETEIDPLIRMAVQHYQFEAIHPFTDGNGRTGRVLNLLFLVEQGLLASPVLYLSRYIIQHKSQYYRLLREVTEAQEWENWILYMMRAVEETAVWTTERIEGIQQLMASTMEKVRAEAPSPYTDRLVQELFKQPYCRISNFTKAGLGHRETVSRHLRKLADIGVLEEKRFGREKLFTNSRLLELLTRP